MSAKIISVTTPIDNKFGNNLTELIAYTARVSNPANQWNHDTAEKLVKYLAENKHWSPFEMVSVCMEIKTTRTIARQLLRHRSFSFQEFSGRYAEMQDFELSEARLQDTKNRQNSIETKDTELQDWWNHQQDLLVKHAHGIYGMALENGIAKEQARNVLPEGLTKSRLYVNGTIRSWIHYIDVRTHESTQKEHRELALDCKKALEPYFEIK